jgi:DnaK suppressor protein
MAKKPAHKPAKKSKAMKVIAKPKVKKAVPAKPAAKKNIAKKKIVVSKKAPAKKAVAKPSKKPVARTAVKPVAKAAAKKTASFSIKSAAQKIKIAFTKKPSKVNKPVIASKPAAKPMAKPVAKPATAIRTAAVAMPKGMLTEDRIRKMSDKDYMNDGQLAFFHYRLLQMRNEVLARELDVKERLHQREVFADPADRATAEEEHWLDLRLRERESLLLRKIDDALRRIADREFGYCEKTGDAIGIPRLLARPTATVCVDVKGQDERIESQFRDR